MIFFIDYIVGMYWAVIVTLLTKQSEYEVS